MTTAYVRDCNAWESWARRNPSKATRKAYGANAIGEMGVWDYYGECKARHLIPGGGSYAEVALDNTGRDEIVRAAREFFGTGARLKLVQKTGESGEQMRIYVAFKD